MLESTDSTDRYEFVKLEKCQFLFRHILVIGEYKCSTRNLDHLNTYFLLSSSKTLEIKAWREYKFEFSRFPIAVNTGANI